MKLKHQLSVAVTAAMLTACGGGGGGESVSTGNTPTNNNPSSADLVAITAFLQSLDNKVATQPAASDLTLMAYFDQAHFLQDGALLGATISALLSGNGTQAFTVADVGLSAVPSWAASKVPLTANTSYLVTWTDVIGSTNVDRQTSVIYSQNGNWYLMGDQEFTYAQVQATEVSQPNGGGQNLCSALFINLGGGAAQPAAVDYAIVTGPGLPPAGVLMVNDTATGQFFVASGNYAGTTNTAQAVPSCGYEGYYQVSDVAIESIPNNAVYTIKFYDDVGTPNNMADDVLVATYTSTVPSAPIASTTLNASYFPSGIVASPTINSLVNAGGHTTVTWGAPSATPEYPYFFAANVTVAGSGTQPSPYLVELQGSGSAGLNIGAFGRNESSTSFTVQLNDNSFRDYVLQTASAVY